MISLSEILGIAVFDERGARLGRVQDLRVDAAHNAVDRIVLRPKGGARGALVWIAWEQVETFSPAHRRVVATEDARCEPLGGSDPETLLLARDVLDRQIIDIQGRKVVRVNDILLEPSGSQIVLRRVETGLASAVRRLLAGVISPPLLQKLSEGLPRKGIPWDYVGMVEPGTARIRLKVHQQLVHMHPADLADILEDLGRVERREIVSALDPETAAQALSEADPSVQAAVVEEIEPDRAADLLEEMAPDEAADILADLSKEASRAVLDAMEREEAEEIRELLSFPEDSAGGIMTSEFFRARAGWTVGETIAEIQKVDEDLLGEMDEIPIVEGEDLLVGVVPLVRLLRSPGGSPVAEFKRRETRAVPTQTSIADVVERFEKYHLRALAVVDDHGRLAGMINIEDVLSRLVADQ